MDKKLLILVIMCLVILSVFTAVLYVQREDKKAMEACQKKFSYDYCFRQIHN
jgi:quinol-cytochrome oxidoreductase complex cytochrome b subunit